MREKQPRHREAEKQGRLGAAEDDQRHCDSECDCGQPRTLVERNLHPQSRERKDSVGNDDAGVIHAAGDGAAKHEHHRGEHAACVMPAAAAADGDHREPADQQMSEHHQVESKERWRRIDQSPKNESRREDQRLRIGDAGVTRVVIGIPERRRTGVDRLRHEAKERIELIFRIPGHNQIVQRPLRRADRPECDDHEKRRDRAQTLSNLETYWDSASLDACARSRICNRNRRLLPHSSPSPRFL